MQELLRENAEHAYKAALERVQTSKGLHRAVDVELPALDSKDLGLLSEEQMKRFLQSLSLSLNDEEIVYVMDRVLDADNTVRYSEFQTAYESVLTEALQAHALDKAATDVELHLLHLFKPRDPVHMQPSWC